MTTPFRWDTDTPVIMGVLNVTPDSFSDGGRYFDTEAAVAHGRALIAAGATVLDVGGESSRPGAAPVSVEEELRRVLPVVERLADAVTVSVDTTKAAVAEAALRAGARIINDISALRFDPRMIEVVAETGAGVVLMHMQGTPQTMQQHPHYEDVVSEVCEFLRQRALWAQTHGLAHSQIAVDPGIGFGKTVEHNVALLAQLDSIVRLGWPVVVGTSRKSFLGHLLGTSSGPRPVGERDWGTAATVAWCIAHGARIVRVHDVAAMRDVVQVTETLSQARKRLAGS